MTRHAAAGLLCGLVLAIGGCGDGDTVSVIAPLPERLLPDRLGSYSVDTETSADKVFDEAGENSLTGRGRVFTLRKDGAVKGALQVGVLKPEFDTDDIEVRRGVRTNIETGRYRWFKVDEQWVGVQDLPELRLYVWFPPRGDLYEVLQLQPDVPDQKQLLADILSYQREDSA